MRKIALLLLPALMYAQDFISLLKLADHNLLLQAKSQEIIAKDALYRSAKSKNYPTLDAKLTAVYLKDTPTMNFNLPFPGMPPKIEVGKKANYTGEVGISYPLFTGFAISGMIEKAQLDKEKAQLEQKDLKRKLYLQIASLYSALYSLNHAISANKEAVNATETSLKKARGFYKAGLLAPSELANIKAQKFAIQAALQKFISQKKSALQMLSYLTGKPIDKIDRLPTLTMPKSTQLTDQALHERADILTLQKLLQIDEADIKLAKSNRYPTLALIGALKLQGDSLKLNGDGFTNPNKSYVGAAVEWKFFDGFETKHKLDAAKAKRVGRILYLKDYQNRVKTTLQNEIDTLFALQLQYKAKQAQLEAQENYYKLTKGRFANHLASADELSRAIAARAAAKAEFEQIKAEIFKQKCTILLETSLEEFQKVVKG